MYKRGVLRFEGITMTIVLLPSIYFIFICCCDFGCLPMPVKSILVRVCFCNQGFPKLEALQVLFGSLVFGSLGCAHAMENQ